ncbi:uncharacterized protein SPPG_03697 [Spizellomyces punctatus DAOM BR117]|uniref:Signal recognition particle, SRP19 subunit n=1 Tax=Spizellomyces punctatus (strain DAOM BR117) TaxID=645134 RepID=A0A0L0HLH3_SPIPD|nr:uncharacterized protein SPPG_03697 [Spizellomyces punctatus DAOM BR117]KND01908.1 hypothetical protein SPPG_03697 [Spizellomyces punctatus DAOM BR117]|eukprot:XP_016609947.1 hypothetical protein SPPG_03697 [Spizellomyces punctatus DAOM BR117]
MDPDDIDNMDFDIPAHLLNAQQQAGPSGSGSAQTRSQPRMVAVDPSIHETAKSWTTLYPVYLDPTKPQRRLAKTLCPSAPSAIYMSECVRLLNLPAVLDPEKRHPADPLVFGRIKVQIKHSATKKPLNPNVTSKLGLLREIAKMYAEVEERMKKEDPRIVAMAAASRSEVSKTIQELAKDAAKESGSGSGGGKKKGKKK